MADEAAHASLGRAAPAIAADQVEARKLPGRSPRATGRMHARSAAGQGGGGAGSRCGWLARTGMAPQAGIDAGRGEPLRDGEAGPASMCCSIAPRRRVRSGAWMATRRRRCCLYRRVLVVASNQPRAVEGREDCWPTHYGPRPSPRLSPATRRAAMRWFGVRRPTIRAMPDLPALRAECRAPAGTGGRGCSVTGGRAAGRGGLLSPAWLSVPDALPATCSGAVDIGWRRCGDRRRRMAACRGYRLPKRNGSPRGSIACEVRQLLAGSEHR